MRLLDICAEHFAAVFCFEDELLHYHLKLPYIILIFIVKLPFIYFAVVDYYTLVILLLC